MAATIKITAEERKESGTTAARRLRRAGELPGVLNLESGGVATIRMNSHDFERMLSKQASETLIADLTIGSQPAKRVLLKEVQRDPVFGKVLHADFVEISMTKKVRVSIAIDLVGEAAGVSQQGGVLERALREAQVECLPSDLVDSLVVNVEALKIGDTAFVRDIKAPPGIIILTPGDVAVASVAAPQAEEEVAAPEAEAGTAAGEPEVITERKKEGEEEAEGDEEETEKGKGKEKETEKGKGKEKGKEKEPEKGKEKGKEKAKEPEKGKGKEKAK